MGFGVFIHRADSIYNDRPAEQYQFPSIYLSRAKACVGDWIIYYEPKKVAATRGYFATAKVERIIPDPGVSGRYLALIEPGSYLDFANPVPFKGPDGSAERDLANRDQWSVRPLSLNDFNRIIDLGIGQRAPLLPRVGEAVPPFLQEEQTPFQFEQDRSRVSYLSSRIVRDRVFRRSVLRAYDERCAVTGLKLINGGGRAEVEAAHIKPVEESGPDIVNNGIALSGTAHWMFDRGLISFADDLEILISRQVNDPGSVRAFINKNGRALEPQRVFDRPHPYFLQWHRENRFKQ